MKDQIKNLIIETLSELRDDMELEGLESIDESTILFGSRSALDSVNLVSLIADLEANISERFEKDLILADERAMSQTRSPFRTVESLTEYIEGLLNEA